jgi:hypothetical protein
MSREQRCVACLDKLRMSVMVARQDEVAAPLANDKCYASQRDLCATGKPQPSNPLVSDAIDPTRQFRDEQGRSHTIYYWESTGDRFYPGTLEASMPDGRSLVVGPMTRNQGGLWCWGVWSHGVCIVNANHVESEDEARAAAVSRWLKLQKPAEAKRVDPMRDPLPPVPRTQEEAMELLRQGWWLRAYGPGWVSCLAMKEGAIKARDNDCQWRQDKLEHWSWPGQARETESIDGNSAWFSPIRPEQSR